MFRLIGLFILCIASFIKGQSSWTSPCPELFRYNDTNSKGYWIGEFTLHSEEELNGIWIRMVFDPEPENVESEFGFIKPQSSIFPTSGEYLLRKTNEVLKPGELLNITIKVRYNDTKRIPLLVGFRLNGDPVCPDDKIIDPSRLMRTKKTERVLNDVRSKRQTNPRDWVSPCPELFAYDLNSIRRGEWSGDIILPKDTERSAVWVRLTLNPRPKTVEADFGYIDPNNTSSDSGEYLIKKSNEELNPGEIIKIRLKITYNPEGTTPLLIGFKLNGNQICPNVRIPQTTTLIEPPESVNLRNDNRDGARRGWRDFLPRPTTTSPPFVDNGFVSLNRSVDRGLSSRQRQNGSRVVLNGDNRRVINPQEWESPCPSLFRYDLSSVKTGEWSGEITLTTEEELGGIWIRLTLDPKPSSVESDFGVVDGRTSTFPTAGEYLIRKTNAKLSPGETLRIKLKVKYDESDNVPLLVGFRLNGDPVCPDDKIIDPARVNRRTGLITSPPLIEATTRGVFTPPKLESPCPSMFRYEAINLDEWTGVISLTSEEDLGGIWVRLTIDPKPLSFQSDFGTTDSRVSVHQSAEDYLIRKTNQRLAPGETLQIRIKVKYDPSKPIPLLIGYRLNGDPICPDDKIIDPTRVKRPGGVETTTEEFQPELFTPPPLITTSVEPIGVSNNLESPCPDLFTYGGIKDGEWTGVLTLTSEEELGGIWVRLTIDPKPLKVESDFGSTDRRGSVFPTAEDYLIRKTNEKLSPGGTLRIKIKVSYDSTGPVPLLVGFRLNGDPVCPDDKIIDPTRIKRPSIEMITPPPLLNKPGELSTSPPITGIINVENLISPCPEMFYYDTVKGDEWIGVIKLTAEEELGGIWVRLTIDPKPLKVESDFGSTDPRTSSFPTSGEYLIRKTNERLGAGETLQIRVTVKFDPTKPVPVLIGYRLNGDPICPDDKIIDPSRVVRPNRPAVIEEFVPPPSTTTTSTTTIDYFQIFEDLTERPKGVGWVSPCPDYFKYDEKSFKKNEWSGDFSITTEEELGGIWIRLTIDPKPLNVKSDFGSIDPRVSTYPTSGDYLIRKTNERLQPGETLKIRITVSYDSPEIPVLVGFRLNGDPVCPDDKVIDPSRVIRPESGGYEPTTYKPPLKNPEGTTISVISNSDRNLFSPCPDVFNYEPISESNRWFGKISWKVDHKIEVPHVVKIIIDQDASQLGNWYGETVTTDNREFIIFGQKPFNVGDELSMRFFIRYGGDVPKLKAIIVNDKTICGSIRLASSSEDLSTGQSYQINRFKNYILIKRGTKTTFIKVDNPHLPIIII